MVKVLLFSHNNINGIPPGRVETGEIVIYSGPKFQAARVGNPPDPTAGKEEQFEEDLLSIETAYIYVAKREQDMALSLIEKLEGQGKKVHMIACDCMDYTGYLSKVKVEFKQSECGGRATMGKIFRKSAKSAAA